jgi:hypothetical protein
MSARPVVGPRRPGQPFADRDRHQPVPRGVEVDLVDAMPVPIMGLQPRLVAVGLVGPALRFGRARQPAEPVEVAGRPRRALALDGRQQRRVGRDVVVDQRRRLIEHLVRHEPESTPG